MKKFYKVAAKCGHVGKRFYYLGYFYEIAESRSEAATIARGRGRVKHDHKDAILSVEEISFEEFLDGMEQKANEPYFRCINPQQQKLYWEEIVQHIFPESRSYDEDREGKRVRRPRYQESFNWRNYDWDDAA